MSESPIIGRADAVLAAFKTASDRLGFMAQQLTELGVLRKGYETEHSQKVDLVALDQKSIEVVKVLIDRVAGKGTEKLQQLVTHGLQTVFTDERYAFEIEISERGNQKEVDLFIRNAAGIRTPLNRSGGGPRVMVSLIVAIYMVVRLKLARVMVLDEVLDKVSSKYADGLFEFLHETVEQLKFDYLVISHRPEYFELADQLLTMKHGALEVEK